MLKLKKIIFAAFVIFALLNSAGGAQSQNLTNNRFGKGIRLMAKDSSFSVKFSARFQTLYHGILNLNNNDYKDGLQIRRSRIKFDGHAYTPKLQYKIELAIANSDTQAGSIPESGNTASIVLDAVLKYNFSGNWSIWFGQTKLPGNRERVISSQALQFVDRSNVNSRFNIDRDLGFQLHYSGDKINVATAISGGEGRNMTHDNAGGYDYTGRIEYLPFGNFSDKGDYFGSDLKREPKPRLSIGITYDYNNRASRSGGQLGQFFDVQRDLRTVFVDAHFKYKGLSSLMEYANKSSSELPYFTDNNGKFQAFYTGQGFNEQIGYLFKNNFEVAGRYTIVKPEKETLRPINTQYALGISKYFVEHSLKIQSDLSLIQQPGSDDALMYRFQVEFAF